MTIVLLLAGVVLLALAQHPFITFPLSLLLLSRFRPRPVAGGALPETAALCVCAYREERVIRDKALNMLAMREAFPALDLLIYVDGGAEGDSTAAMLAAFEPAIHVVRAQERTGKTAGMNTLLTLTSAECVIFSDANVTFDAAAVPALLRPFADPEVGVACGHLRYRDVRGSATAATGSLYWRYEEALKRLESATGSVMGADGSIFAMRRRYCRPVPPYLIDDMYASLAALCDGARIVRVEDALAYEDQVSRSGEEFRRKIAPCACAWRGWRRWIATNSSPTS
jgi:cellulose synthase/poly-beta-1,6-N-acetylglucosamine synthase-like glycosyltransferase